MTFSRRCEVSPTTAGSPRETLRSFLGKYLGALEQAGCAMIGHLKGMLDDGESPPLFFSVTSLKGEPQFKGGPLKGRENLALSITVIAAGIGEDEAAGILEGVLAESYRKADRE
jgi:hypothetical protein